MDYVPITSDISMTEGPADETEKWDDADANEDKIDRPQDTGEKEADVVARIRHSEDKKQLKIYIDIQKDACNIQDDKKGTAYSIT